MQYTLNQIDNVKNRILADYNNDGDVGVADLVAIQKSKELLTNPIQLEGTLKEKSTYEISNINPTMFKVTVTLPQNTTGTIGITVKEGVFKCSSTTVNQQKTSELKNINLKGTSDGKITISEGLREGNKVTFKINLPKDTALKGDVDLNGKIEEEDINLITKYLLDQNAFPLTEIQKKAADAATDGVLNTVDSSVISSMQLGTVSAEPATLNGSLAGSSQYELVKDSNGNYSIVVTIPEGTKEGTIGITIPDETFIYELGLGNESVNSELFDIATNANNDNNGEFKVIKQEDKEQSDGKIKVTVITNKELDPNKIPNGWTLGEDGKSIWKIMNKGEKEELNLVAKDGSKITYSVVAGSTLDKKNSTTSNNKLPQTGIKNTIIAVIAVIAIVGIVAFIRYRKNMKVK